MSPAAGWYPDPGGQPATFRYWDGQAWTTVTRPAEREGSVGPGGAGDIGPGGGPRRRRVGWILAGVALVVVLGVVLALVVVFAVRTIGGPEPTPPPPTGGPTCPEAVQPTGSPPPAGGNRVTSGRLSYPRLGPPFSGPAWDPRVPFGRDVQSQQATVETNASGTPTWVAGVVIARLLAGDGFYGPQQGAEVVATCITGLFYGQAAVERVDSRNEATIVDGRPAWIIEAHLTFELPDIETTGETMTVVVVDVGSGEAGLFYGSNPDTSPQFAAPIRQAQTGLRVS